MDLDQFHFSTITKIPGRFAAGDFLLPTSSTKKEFLLPFHTYEYAIKRIRNTGLFSPNGH